MEIAGSLVPTPQEGGPQSVNSILNSVRVASSFVDETERPGLVRETSSSRPSSTFSPRIRYSHQISEDFFLGFVFARGEKVRDSRTSLGTNGLFLKDNVTSQVDEIGFRVGWGPLNYMTDESSSEFSFGYSEVSSTGPYNSSLVKFPGSSPDSSSITQGLGFAFGTVEYRTKNYSLSYSYAGSITDWLNFYFQSDLTIFSGKLKLASYSIERRFTSAIDPTTGAVSSPLGSNQFDFTAFQSKDGFLSGLGGMNFSLELGLVWKFWESFGLRYGGFYQLSYFGINEISGLNLRPGSTPLELSSLPDLTSSLKGKEFGSFGFSFALVKNL